MDMPGIKFNNGGVKWLCAPPLRLCVCYAGGVRHLHCRSILQAALLALILLAIPLALSVVPMETYTVQRTGLKKEEARRHRCRPRRR